MEYSLHVSYLRCLVLHVFIKSIYPSVLVAAKVNFTQTAPTPISASILGNVMLGGLFPVHVSEDGDAQCGKINAERGIQRVEAMLFTLDKINSDNTILPNITLGATIFDTCARGTYALEQSLEYIRASFSSHDASEFMCVDGSKAKSKHESKTVAGVIGGSYSTVSIQVANLLRLFKIPQISYASTSSQLSDKTRYEYFVRTVPPDDFQAKAMVDIVHAFNWTYVSTVASEGEYGVPGIESFQQHARARNICLAETLTISVNPVAAEYNSIVDKLLKKNNANVVVLFLNQEDAKGLLIAAKNRNITGKFTWLAADGWGAQQSPVIDNELSAAGALTIILQAANIPEFDKYFRKLDPRNNTRNPWFAEYWEIENSCRFLNQSIQNDSHMPMCTGEERFSLAKYKQESKVQFIYDAVYALADSIDRLRKDECFPYSEKCPALNKINGEILLKKYILNTSFDDGYGTRVQFDSKGDSSGRYVIMNYQLNKTSQQYEYRNVGSWGLSSLNLSYDDIVWPDHTNTVPFSRCSHPCNYNEIKHIGDDGDKCCWVCIKCQSYEYLKDEYTCYDCGEGRWPYEHRRACYTLKEQYIEFDSVYSIIPLMISALGIMATLFVILTFFKYNNTPVVKASGRELNYMLLCGCLLCYLMTVVLILKPTLITCAIQRFGIGFGFAVIYSALLTKTNRISRIFDSARKSAGRPRLISPKSQILISTVLVSIQVIITIIWFVLELPGTRLYYPNGRRDEVILKCKTEDISFLISLIYNIILITVCTFYAIKTRKIPENFNESKLIGFSMYTTCIIWLAFVPIYFGALNSFQFLDKVNFMNGAYYVYPVTHPSSWLSLMKRVSKNNAKVQISTLCISISLSATVVLACLFSKKMYIIFFQKEKNVRKLTTMTSVHTNTDFKSNFNYSIGTIAPLDKAGGASAETQCTSTNNLTQKMTTETVTHKSEP